MHMATPTLFTSNRLELLARDLAHNISAPLSSPFQPELIVTQSQSMARWLRLELAREHGISANCIFPFPKHFARLIFSSALPDVAEESPFEPESLVWVILKQLPALLNKPEFAPLKNYLGSDNDPRKLFQLSDKIARLFDQYLVFRPEMILEWDNGKTDGWQAMLWREVTSALGKSHPAALRNSFLNFATKPKAKFSKPAERISIFGISALPKFHLEMFEALAPHSQISFYLLQPCAQWWGYISSDHETEKSLKRTGRKSESVSELHIERGNRLLASLGQQGRDFLNLIHEFEWTEHERSEDSGEDTLLHCVQSDILNLRDRGMNDSEKKIVAPSDTSIQVHDCHSPLREMEVLHDHLLDWFSQDPTLTPRDILVMTPDIETYAPFIQAVFDSPEHESQRIPLSIADCGPRSQSQVVETFLKILTLPQSRLGSTTVLSLLETPAVRIKFGLAENDLDRIRSWIENTGIRWGKDAAQRAELGLPEISDHTWEHGLNRLMLGYALAGKDRELFNGILPYDDVEGEAAIVLGKFAEFLERLFETVERLKTPRQLSVWADFLRDVLESFFQPTEQSENDFRIIRTALAGFNRNETLSGFDSEVTLDVILELLSRELNQDPSGAGYLTGGVTFCALKPMRSIPFKIICLVGLNDGAFPRADSWLSFDLMAQAPRLGDRSSREDDRYLFLETLISAREKLYISYAGQSIRDNSESPPSVLVNQLLDYLEQGFAVASGVSPDVEGGILPPGPNATTFQDRKNFQRTSTQRESVPPGGTPGSTAGGTPAATITDLIVTKHRLQAFSPAYFSGGRLFSYSRENLRASQSVQPDRAAPKPFLTDAIAEPENEWHTVSVEMLAEFFCHPAKFLATRRLGIYLPRLEAALEDSEPFALDALNNYLLKQQMLELRIEGRPLKGASELFSATGTLPAGLPGEAAFGNLRSAVESFYSKLKPHLADASVQPVPVELAIGDFQISGQFKEVTSAGLLAYRCAKIKPKDLLRAWVRHLVWNTAQPHGQPLKSKLIGADFIYEFGEVRGSQAILDLLLKIYWRGLTRAVKFFPQSSLAFCETGGRSSPAKKARDEWEGSEYIPGESADEYFDLFFRHTDPLDDEFATLAGDVFKPLLEHAQKTEL